VAGTELYDDIGAGYSLGRRTDPRWMTAVLAALGDARSIVDVGAGTGSYEPHDRTVLAVEPSLEMIRQRPHHAKPAVRAVAEALPVRDNAVDAALAVLTVHHWDDQLRGVAEMRRVARERVVIFTYDVTQAAALWLVRDYLPEIAEMDRGRFLPMDELVAALGGATVTRVPIAHDCRDGFLGAFWRRPERYLEPALGPGCSAFHELDPAMLERGLARLRNDLDSGAWRRRYGGLLTRDELDVGYRLVVAEP
jgi:SAM-dependent methyltransferase